MNKRNVFGIYKRALIVFIFLIPIFVIINNVLGENTGNFTKISLSVLVAIVVVGVVEWVRYRRMQK